jgi:hypothetical protein
MNFSKLTDKDLEKNITRLKFLCDNLDPYSPIEGHFKKELSFFEITKFRDPYDLTNQLLKLMEDSLEEKENRKLH